MLCGDLKTCKKGHEMKLKKKQLAMLAAILSIFFASLTSYSKPVTAGGSVSSLVHQYCSSYKNFPHFRAAAGAGGWQGSIRGTPWSVGCVAGQTSAKSAVYLAMARCQRIKKKYDIGQACQLYFLGDVDVSGLRGEDLEQAKTRYQENEDKRRLADRNVQHMDSPPTVEKTDKRKDLSIKNSSFPIERR